MRDREVCRGDIWKFQMEDRDEIFKLEMKDISYHGHEKESHSNDIE